MLKTPCMKQCRIIYIYKYVFFIKKTLEVVQKDIALLKEADQHIHKRKKEASSNNVVNRVNAALTVRKKYYTKNSPAHRFVRPIQKTYTMARRLAKKHAVKRARESSSEDDDSKEFTPAQPIKRVKVLNYNVGILCKKDEETLASMSTRDLCIYTLKLKLPDTNGASFAMSPASNNTDQISEIAKNTACSQLSVSREDSTSSSIISDDLGSDEDTRDNETRIPFSSIHLGNVDAPDRKWPVASWAESDERLKHLIQKIDSSNINLKEHFRASRIPCKKIKLKQPQDAWLSPSLSG